MTPKRRLTLIASLAAAVAVLLWLAAPAGLPRFGNLPAVLTSLGQVFGLIGVVLFSLSLILSARLRLFDRLFNGLNNVYIKHNQIGQIAFILLLFHPLLLIPKYATNAREAAAFLWFSGDWAINWGIVALLLMIVLLVLTLYLRPKYNIWKLTHKFLGVAFLLGSLHVWLIPSDTSRFLPLKVYVLGFSLLGLVAFVYRTVLGKFLVKKYQYVVTRVKKVSATISEIVLEPRGPRLQFRPGQFVFLQFAGGQIGAESHPFSITAAPGEKQLSFLVKNLGDYTSKINSLSQGATAMIEGPFGNFGIQDPLSRPQIWIAGGIGITPFVSMAKSLAQDGGDYSVDLYYCTRDREEAVALDVLERVAKLSSGKFRVRPFYSRTEGRFSVGVLEKECGQFAISEFFICAPPVMIADLKKSLMARGVERDMIKSEEFDL